MSVISPIPASSRLPRRWRFAKGVMRVAVWLLLAEIGLLLVLWLCLHWVILPHIEQWRPLIETKVSQALGVAVKIAGIEVRSNAWVPALEVRDVSLFDSQGRLVLRLPSVHVAVSVRSALAFISSLDLRLEQLVIDGAQLEVRRDASGRIFVAGIDFSAPQDDGSPSAADWFFKQYEFAVRGGSLRWIDEQRAAPSLVLTGVDVTVRNGLFRHELRLDATPSVDWGERFSLRGRFTHPLLARSGDWQRWSGQAYAHLPQADVSLLRQYLTLPFELSQGEGALRMWMGLREGQARDITLDLALRAVSLRLAGHLEPLAVEQVHGRLTGQRREDGGSLSLQQFGFLTGDGVRWPVGDVSMSWTQAPDGTISGGKISADRLDLDPLSQTATRIPLGNALRQLLSELDARGLVNGLSADWTGPLDAPVRYRVNAQLSGLTLAAKPSAEAHGVGRPGLRDAQIEFTATEKGGDAMLAMTGGALDLPGVFEDAVLPLDRFSAAVVWRVEPSQHAAPRIEVTVTGATFSNADAQGAISATWNTGRGEGFALGGRYPGALQLDGTLRKGVAARVARYLPLGIPVGVRDYVARAVRSGGVSRATFRVKGDLFHFPFDAAEQGEFRIAMQAEDVNLAYVPSVQASGTQAAYKSPWPALNKVNGEVVIDRTSLEIRNARAELYGVQLSKINGGISDLADQPVLALGGQCIGPLADMLRFATETPVDAWTGHRLQEVTATGSAELQLSLKIPLDEVTPGAVGGELLLRRSDVRIGATAPLLAAARGRVRFSQHSLEIVEGSARVLGGLARLGGRTQPDGSLRINAQGNITAEGLRRASELGPLSRFASRLEGQADYRFTLGLVGDLSEVEITSNLAGLAVDLPAPLGKSAEAALPMRYQTTLVRPARRVGSTRVSTPPRDTLRFELGDVVQVQYLRDLAGKMPRVLRGGVGVNEPAPEPTAGVSANIRLPNLNMDAWDAVITQMLEPGLLSGPAGDVAAADGSGAGYVPTSVALRAQEFSVGTRKLTRLVAGMSQVDGLWRANVDADQLDGYLEYRPTWGAEASGRVQDPSVGRVHARLSRLTLPKSDAEQVENLLDQQSDNVPGLDIVVDEFQLRGKRLGRVEIEADNQSTPERQWRLSRFAMSTPEAKLTAQGSWAMPAIAAKPSAIATQQRRMGLDFKLELADSGAFLERLGSGKVIRGGKGVLHGNVAWMGSPLNIDYASLSGQMNLVVESGQFLKGEPGAARLLGVLSLQSLPRRLVLDFRDVFQEGFAFDSVTGDVKIAQGVAVTNNLRMRGVQAAVLMDGSADIERETQDLRVVVVPEINAGTASLVYAAINPAVGLGTFLAQLFLRQPLIQAGTREFHVSGPWADPTVVRVERTPGQPVPDIGAAPAAEAASAAAVGSGSR